MRNQSKLLKVVSILLIVFGVLGLISNAAVGLMSSSLSSVYETAGVAAPGMGSILLGCAGAIVEIAAGVIGVMYKNRQMVLVAGIVWTLFVVVNLVISTISAGFMVTYLLSFILPVLYLWGWYQSN